MTEDCYANRFDDLIDDWHRTGTATRQADFHNPVPQFTRTAKPCADQMNLQRFQNEDEVQDAVRRGVLIALPETLGLHVAPSLPLSRRYARPTTVQFLLTLSEAYRLRFGKYLTIDSAVRDADTQRRLRKHNRNAAPVDGETASSHETGATIDIAKRGMTRAQLQWTRAMLSYEVVMNRAIVEEEKHQACFHTMVLGGTE